MTDLLRYRQPLPTTIFTAGIAAFVVWVLANYITGTDFLWVRVLNVFALVLFTPVVLESVGTAIINSPDDRNLRLLYGAITANLFCLFPIIAFFGYIQYASTFSKLLLAVVALGVGIYAGRKTPDIPADIVEIYKPVKSKDWSGFVWFYLYYILPLLLIVMIFMSLNPLILDDVSKTGDNVFPISLLLLLLPLGALFPRVATGPREKVYFGGKFTIRDREIPLLIFALILFADSILQLQ